MTALEEKNTLTQELDQTRKVLEDMQLEKVRRRASSGWWSRGYMVWWSKGYRGWWTWVVVQGDREVGLEVSCRWADAVRRIVRYSDSAALCRCFCI